MGVFSCLLLLFMFSVPSLKKIVTAVDIDRISVSRADNGPTYSMADLLPALGHAHPTPCSAGDMLARHARHSIRSRSCEEARGLLVRGGHDNVF